MVEQQDAEAAPALATPDGLVDAAGVYQLPEAQYHADPCREMGGSLSSTTLRALTEPSVPALARHAVEHPEHKDDWDLGSVTHRFTLGAGVEILEVDAPDWTAAGAAGRAAKDAARAAGKVPLLSKDIAAARAMAAAVHRHTLARALLTAPGAPEITIVWQEGETWCRLMADRHPDPSNTPTPFLVDLKTTEDVDDHHLTRTIWQWQYHRQAEWYRRGYRAVHGVDPDFAFVFVRKKAPHIVRVVRLTPAMWEDARVRNDEALQVWRDCQASGVWPDYPDTEFVEIGPPRWASTREDYNA